MLEPIIVDHPEVFPSTCAACGTQTGPMLDTHRELANLRVYVCRRCSKNHARIFGFAKGERLDELENAAASVAELVNEIASLSEQLAISHTRHLERDREDRERNDAAVQLRERVHQLEGTIRERNEAAARDMALVGD